MKKNPLVSIIVPVFNVEDYLEETVKSLTNQSYNNIEIILVDDGSTDSSRKIAYSLAAVDSRICVVHKEWGGLSDSRNAGLEKARGEWIAFVDSDDLLHPEFCSRLLSIALSSSSQIAAAYFLRASVPGNFFNFSYSAEPRIMSGEEAVRESLYQGKVNNSMCMKLFSKELFSDLRFRKGILYEDLDIFYRIGLKANSVAITADKLYFYRIRENSIIATFNPARLDVLDVTDRLCTYIKYNHPSLLPAAESRKLSANFNMLFLMSREKGYDKEKERFWRNICALRRTALRDRNVRLKNRIASLLSFGGKKFILSVFSLFQKR